ncbi:pancreatic lipase-related protein 2 isoform X2 [Nasonia vitripennis]|nr:pancreatic lipase-related protein 2 isoform X2 [Nasonia vitripennis]
MRAKSLISLCTILLAFAQVHTTVNPGRLLKCSPHTLKYETFNVSFYHSSRTQSDQLINKEVHFVPKGVDFDPRRRTVVIVQGFLGHLHGDEMKKIGNKLLEWQDMNVIIVRWEKGSLNPFAYPQAVVNSEYAALQIKTLFTWLKNIWTEQGVSLGSWGPIHFIGYSLGAHVVGQAAERLRVEENLLIDRITALDPSEPCFEDANNPLRLSKNNAKFVDVIHTDGARYTNEAFGLLEPIGHADFYVNGGVANQPGCERKKRSGFLFKATLHFLGNGLCSHARSVEVFIDSIVNANSTSCKFWGRSWQLGTSEADTKEILKNSCDTTICPQVGINAESFDYDNGKTNTYYVKTSENAPFCEPA